MVVNGEIMFFITNIVEETNEIVLIDESESHGDSRENVIQADQSSLAGVLRK